MKSSLPRTDRQTPALLVGAVLATCLLASPPSAHPSPGAWIRKADLPEIRVGAAADAIDGTLYVAAGNTAPLVQPQPKTLFAYDPEADAWSRKANIPTGRELAASGVVDGILYVAGGIIGANPPAATGVLEAYDPKTDTWTRKASMPSARGELAGCVLDGLFYTIGGWSPTLTVPTVECYDPGTDQWTRKASLPVAAEVPVVQVAGGRIYVFADQQAFSYDPATDAWTPRASPPAGKLRVRATAAGTVDGRVYLMGSLLQPSFCASEAALAYDPITDRYTDLPAMPTPTFAAASAVLRGKIYVAGGASGHPPTCPQGVVSKSLWVYEPMTPAPPPGTWTRKADLPEVRVGAASGEIDGVLYVAAGNTAPLAQPQPKTLFAYDPTTDAWARKADIPTGRDLAAAGVVDGILYVAGGLVGATPNMTDVVEAYDPGTDTWTRKASMPTARGDVVGCVLNGLFYTIGGIVPGTLVPTVECYDPKTDQWTRKASLPVVAEVPAVQVVNGRIHVFVDQLSFSYDPTTDTWTPRASLPAGRLQVRTTAAGTVDGWVYLMGGLLYPSACGSKAMLAYDPIWDRYTDLPPLPDATFAAASAVLGGKIYVAGGSSGYPPTCPQGVVSKSLWVYEPNTTAPPPGTWTRKADLPEVRAGAVAGAIDGVLYVAAGNTAPFAQPQPKTLFAYDPKSNAWSRKADIPTGRDLAAAGVVDGVLYVAGGLVGTAPNVTAVVEAYDPRTDTWTRKAPMPTARGDVSGCVLQGVLYAIGGWVPGGFLSTVESYDPRTDQWTTKASLPIEAEVPAVQIIDGHVYAFVDQQTFSYDPTTDAWTPGASLPAGQLQVRATAAGTIDGWVYLMGGLLRPSLCGSGAMLAYNPILDRYATLPPMPWTTFAPASAVLDGRIYLAGGATGVPPDCPEGVVGRSLWVYTPERAEAPTLVNLSMESGDRIRLQWRGQIGRRYGVETTCRLPSDAWTRCATTTGTTVIATSTSVDATLPASAAETTRFFRVIVAD